MYVKLLQSAANVASVRVFISLIRINLLQSVLLNALFNIYFCECRIICFKIYEYLLVIIENEKSNITDEIRSTFNIYRFFRKWKLFAQNEDIEEIWRSDYHFGFSIRQGSDSSADDFDT